MNFTMVPYVYCVEFKSESSDPLKFYQYFTSKEGADDFVQLLRDIDGISDILINYVALYDTDD